MNQFDKFSTEIELKNKALAQHEIYSQLNEIESLKIFMRYHVFAVWDFMSLLKSLQIELTCTHLPWRPSKSSSDAVRFINEIVVSEESDLDHNGKPLSHYEMYLDAMKEVGASTQEIETFVEDLSFEKLPKIVCEFVTFNLSIASSRDVVKIASVFLFGREKLIPRIFEPALNAVRNSKLQANALEYYLARHIELDGDEHGPMAQKVLDGLCEDDEAKWAQAMDYAVKALDLRKNLWDFISKEIRKRKSLESAISL